VPTLAGGGPAHGWLSLLSVALCIAPQAWPPLQADPCLAAPALARLLLVTLQALAQPYLEVRPPPPPLDTSASTPCVVVLLVM
jgi:hypothetical protein